MKMRAYQREALGAVKREWQSAGSTLVVMPTGTGKTILFASLIRSCFPGRALVLAHREELVFQAVDKIHKVTGFRCEVEMADYRADLGAGLFGGPQVVVSTIQTQCSGADGGGRMTRFDPGMFGLLIVDEAHHATAATYRRVIEYYRQNPALKVLGVTATPDRADEVALGQVYETVAFDYEILNAIEDGWLVPIQQQVVEVSGLDFSGVRTTAGDLNGADLARVMEEERNLHEIAGPTVEIVGDRRALVFAASVAHAERLCDIFNRHRAGCAGWVCGKTDKDERRKTLAAFSAGNLQYVVNVGVLTEGFDDPGVEVVVMGRPTKSRSLYAQMVGRATRPLPGLVDGVATADERRMAIGGSRKPACLVVDFVGNSGRHKLMTSADILGGNVSDEAVAKAVAKAKQAGGPVDMAKTLAEEEKALELERAREAARRAHLTAKASWAAKQVNPFDVFQLSPVKARGWNTGKTLSGKQRAILAKAGIDPDSVDYAGGQQLLNEIFRRWDAGLCSYKQARVLRKNGYDGNQTREDASRILDGIFGEKQKAENGKQTAEMGTGREFHHEGREGHEVWEKRKWGAGRDE
jgi:superfamily II DNA or RNA helicase